MLEDHNKRNPTKGKQHQETNDGPNFTEIRYADETLLEFTSTRATYVAVNNLGLKSEYCYVISIKGKCKVLSVKNVKKKKKNNKISYSNGTSIEHVEKATHLGGLAST